MVFLPLVLYSRWLHTLRNAEGDFRDGRYQSALAQYRAAQQRLPVMAAALPFLRPALQEASLKQVQILYLNREFEEALESLQRLTAQYPFLASDSQYHQWYGNVLFQHALSQQDPGALLDGLQAALREFQKALELDGTSWDARYNYELVKHILTTEAEAGQQKLELLLEEIRQKTRRNKQDLLPPEKRG